MLRLLTLVLAASTILSVPAAASDVITRSATASVAGLDLNKTADVHTLMQRLDAAADKSCGGRPFSQNLHPAENYMQKDYRQCRQAALVRAVASVKSSAVKTYFAENDHK